MKGIRKVKYIGKRGLFRLSPALAERCGVDFRLDAPNRVFLEQRIFGYLNRLAEGAVNALSESRLAGSVYVTGQDAELAACQRIVEGTQHMTVYKPISLLAEGAAEIAVKMALGEDIGSKETINDGTWDIPYIVYEPIPVTVDNIVDTVIQDGFYTVEQVYMNVPQSEWPQ